MKKATIALALSLALPAQTFAIELVVPHKNLIELASVSNDDFPYRACFDAAAEQYDIDPFLLKAIAWNESRFDSEATNTENATPTEDVGIMQINSWWLNNSLGDLGVERDHLFEPCFNIFVGSWILANEIQNRGSLWTAVGYYNAKTEHKRKKYISNVKQAYEGVLSGQVLSSFLSKPYKSNPQKMPNFQHPQFVLNDTYMAPPKWEEVKALIKLSPRPVKPTQLPKQGKKREFIVVAANH